MLHLSVNQQLYPLIMGRHLSNADLPGLIAVTAGGPIAVVSVNPTNPSVLGLTNHSTTTWQAVLPSCSVKEIEPERTVKLEAGTQIIFGSYAAEVIDLPAPSSPYSQLSAPTIQPQTPSTVGAIREVHSTRNVSQPERLQWISPKRWLPALVGSIFLSALTSLLFNDKHSSLLKPSTQADHRAPTDTGMQLTPRESLEYRSSPRAGVEPVASPAHIAQRLAGGDVADRQTSRESTVQKMYQPSSTDHTPMPSYSSSTHDEQFNNTNELDELANEIFWRKYPQMRGKKLASSDDPLAAEWNRIRRCDAIVDRAFYHFYPSMKGRTINSSDYDMVMKWNEIRSRVTGCH